MLKAKLTVALKANDVVVAELEDPGLWQRVLAAINVGEAGSQKSPNTGADAGASKEWSAWSEQAK